jgi:hypothetical protein
MQICSLEARIRVLKIPLEDDKSNDRLVVRTSWKASLKLLKTIWNHAFEYHAVHLLSTLEMYQARSSNIDSVDNCSSEDNNRKIQRIHRLINIESMRQPFRQIHSAIPTHRGGGLSKLFVPVRSKNAKVAARFCNPDGTISKAQLIAMAQSDKRSVDYEVVLDSKQINSELLLYNREWFRQAKSTPFGEGDLFRLLDYDGLTAEADSIISGECIEYMGIPMSRELRVFLEECKRPSTVRTISSVISFDDFRKTVRTWKESTSNSPSGRHLGHYKVALLDDMVADIHTSMLNLPIAFGFAPSRWKHSVTPLIEKDDGKPYLTRLRVIHLFEADYNLFLKLIYGRCMVRNAERSNALNDQQHGSRPRRMTTDAILLSRLEKDLVRQTKTNSAHMDNDATGCYDRIVISLGMLACRQLGMPPNAIRCQAATLALMQYAIKTVHGISPTTYHGTDTDPLFGTGQGSGASPAIWLGLVVILLNALDRMSREDGIPGLSFTDPWGDFSASWRVGAFVDDTNQGILDTSHLLNPDELVEYLRQAGQMWENLLHISGGSLNLAKCSWTLQFWEWKNGPPILRPCTSDDPILIMTSGSDPAQHIIQRHTNEIALKGLGVHMNFHGTFSHHATQMRQKFDGIARRLRQSQLSPVLTRLFYNSFYIPSVKYSLPVTSMTNSELNGIQSHITAVTLNRLGYNRHYPHVATYAPTTLFGCGLLDLRLEQGLSHLQALLDYVGTNHKMGRVMIISLRTLQIEAGVSFDLLRHPHINVPHVSECWIMQLRRFCADCNVAIQVKANRLPTGCREYDHFLMDRALTLGFTK